MYMISVYGNLSHDLTITRRPKAFTHASWAWAVNATKVPITVNAYENNEMSLVDMPWCIKESSDILML